MKKVLKVDNQGFFMEDVILQDGEATPIDCIETQCHDGFYKPKWDGTAWIEGLTQAEIDTIKNAPVEQPLEVRNRADIDYIAIMTGVEL
jgi:hypothetical protein